MTLKFPYASLELTLITILIFLPNIIRSDVIIPSDKSKLDSWFNKLIIKYQYHRHSSSRRVSLKQGISTGPAQPRVINVQANGKAGDYKTISDALKSIPENNKNRVILKIGPGNYTEKITIEKNKPFVTFYGDPKNMPVIVYNGTALEYGTVDSATLIVSSDYFVGVNLKVVNSAPRPDGKRKGAQAVALRISGDKSSFYNCRFYGFQDTLCDDNGKHFFKDCYIEGTYDFIFGSGKSLYLNSELHVIPGDAIAVITAHARQAGSSDVGFSFVHCKVTGELGGAAYLGRSWKEYGRVVFAYSDLSDVVNPQGWSTTNRPQYNKTVYFGEFNNMGAGSNLSRRAPFTKKLTFADAKQCVSLDFVEATKWLMLPHAA